MDDAFPLLLDHYCIRWTGTMKDMFLRLARGQWLSECLIKQYESLLSVIVDYLTFLFI